MAYTATWVPPTHTAEWPAPPASILTLHALGDFHLAVSDGTDIPADTPIWPRDRGRTNYDAIGYDLLDRVISRIPDALVQVGDITDNGTPRSYPKLLAEQQMAKDWKARYGIEWYGVQGNHDRPRDYQTAQEWARAMLGRDQPYYKVDLGDSVLLVLGWDNNQWEPGVFDLPCGPLEPHIITWLDEQLSADSRPTIIATHPPLAKSPTANPTAISGNQWWTVQTTIDGSGVIDINAQALQDVIGAHNHAVVYLNAHTHDIYGTTGRGPNCQLLEMGGRQVAAVDTGAVLDWPASKRVPPITCYLSLLDDGRSVEVRWRHHDHHLWLGGVAGGGRVNRLVVP